MPSEMKVNKISPASGTAITLGDSGDTFTIPSGATITNNGTQNGFGSTSASDLTSGTLPDARFPATLPAASGVNLTALNATNLGSGTIADARFPATLPAASGVNLTALNATNLGSGTVPTARLGAGKVLQVVSGNGGMYSQNTTSTTYQDVEASSGVPWELAITPSSTSNYLLVLGHYGIFYNATNTQNRYNLAPHAKIGSGSYSNIAGGNETTGVYQTHSFMYGQQISAQSPFHIKYSPNTTSQVKVKLMFKVQHSGYGASITVNANTGGETRMTVMEISG